MSIELRVMVYILSAAVGVVIGSYLIHLDYDLEYLFEKLDRLFRIGSRGSK